MNLFVVSFLLLTFLLLFILVSSYIDYRRKRRRTKTPSVSFFVPCYNDGDSVEDAIHSIYKSYDKKHMEVIVVDDKSTDDSLKKLRSLKRRLAFRLIEQKRNTGKAAALNNATKHARGEVFFFVDADVRLNKAAVDDILARMEEERVVAASSPYRPKQQAFLPLMQEMEYNYLSFMQGAHNMFSTVSVWGGCFAVEKGPFKRVHGLSPNAIIEDMDLALKLKEAGFRVEQSFKPIDTVVPDKVPVWYKQKIRWSSGAGQAFVRHLKTFLESPLHIILWALFSVLSLITAVNLITQIAYIESIYDVFHLVHLTTPLLSSVDVVGHAYGTQILLDALASVAFAVFSIPFTVPLMEGWKDVYKALYAIPYALLYFPIFTVVSTYGFIIGLAKYKRLEKAKRAW